MKKFLFACLGLCSIYTVQAASYYVNDASTTGDVFTSALGNNANPGTSALPFATLTFALTVAGTNDIIYVDAGTYNDNNLVLNASKAGITIRGAGISATVFDGTPHTGIYNFATITGSNIHIENLTVTEYDNAGAIDITASSTLDSTRVYFNGVYFYRNETFTSFDTNPQGGAVWISASGANIPAAVYFNDCHLGDNLAEQGSGGGALYATGQCHLIITDCRFSCNNSRGVLTTYEGGAILLNNSSASINRTFISGSKVIDQQGGAIRAISSLSTTLPLTINASTFTDNSGRQGAAVFVEGRFACTITNSLFYANKVSSGFGDGGTISCLNNGANNPTMSIINSTIADNTTTSGGDGAGLSNESAASYTVYNSIIWGNTNFNVNATSTITATYCIIQPVGDMHSGTTGNLTSNPLFTGGTNYTLQVTSPAINAGNTAGAPAIDITSASRSGNPDMGCFESGSTNPTTSLVCTLFLDCTNPTITSATPANSICSGQSFTTSLVSSPAGATYLWTSPSVTGITGHSTSGNGNINETLTNTTTNPLTVTYTITPINGLCTGTAVTYSVTVNPYPSINSTAPVTSLCSGTTFSTSLSSSVTTAGTTYSWTSAAVTGISGHATSGTGNISETLTNTTTGPLDITYTITPSFNGCDGTPVNYTVTVNPVAVINSTAPATSICSGSTFTTSLSSTTSGASTTYAWTSLVVSGITGHSTSGTGNISETLINTSTVPLDVSYTITPSFNSCAGTPVTYTVTINPVATITSATPPTSICSGETFTTNLSAGTGPSTSFSWTSSTVSGITGHSTTGTGDINETLTNTSGAPLTVSYTITPAFAGCDGTPTTYTLLVDVINISLSSIPVITCTATSVTLSGNSTSSGVDFNWIDNGGNPAGLTPNAASTVVSSTGTYFFIVTNPVTGCDDTLSLTVTTDTTSPSLSLNPAPVLDCNNTTYFISGFSGSSDIVYQWTDASSNPAGTNPDSSATGINVAGTYTLTVTDTISGCSTNSSLTVTQGTAPLANAGGNSLLTCIDTAITLDGSLSDVGINIVYSWTGPGIVTGGTTTTPTVNINGLYILTVTDTTTGCFSTDTVQINSNTTIPSVTTSASSVIDCNNTSITLTASATGSGLSYAWTGPGLVSGGTTSTPTVNQAGVYTVIVTDASNGCTDTSTVTTTIDTLSPVITAGNDTLINCNQTSIQLSALPNSSSYTYTWIGPGVTSGATTANPTVNASGTYVVIVEGANGCTASDTIQVNSLTGPTAAFTTTTTSTQAPVTVSTNNSSTGSGLTYDWNFGNGDTSTALNAGTTYTSGGSYTITLIVTDTNGCTATATTTIEVLPYALDIPNGFTPNGDGINDAFVIVGIEQFPDNEIKIFNRWGDLIYSAQPYNSEWNGLSNNKTLRLTGDQVVDGTYFFILDLHNESKPYNGYVELKTK